MLLSPESIEQAWRSLSAAGHDPEFPLSTVRLPIDSGYGPVRLGSGQDGTPHLLVPTMTGRRLPDNLSGQAVQVRMTQYVVQGRSCDFIEVRSIRQHLEDVFRRLVEEILRRLALGKAPEVAVSGAIRELRDLLQTASTRGSDFLAGLFGELSLLSSLLQHNPLAALSWTGPDPLRHDFSGMTLSAEVKTSRRLGSHIVRISSLEQLELPSDGRALLLVHFVVEPAGAGGQSLCELLESVYRLASNPSVLDRALANLDIEDWRSDATLASTRFGVVNRAVYRVLEGFPRITRGAFLGGTPPLGVSHITYELDLAHAAKYRATDHEALLIELAKT